MQRKQTVLDITAGDLSGLEAAEKRIDRMTEKAAKLREELSSAGGKAAGGRSATPEERLESQRLQNEALSTRLRIVQESREAAGENAARRAEQTEAQKARQAESAARSRVLGVGQFGAGALTAAASGSPGGLIGGLSALTSNPYALATLAVGGAAAFVGKQGLDESYAETLAQRKSIAAMLPYAGRTALDKARIVGQMFTGATALGYDLPEAMQSYTRYAATAGLEDRGLAPLDVLAMERTRGINSMVSGTVSSMFAAGRGGAGGNDPDRVAQFFRSAIGEGLAQGLKNAHLPEYLSKVAEVTTRYARAGFDVNPLDILGVQAGMRATGGRFEGTRAMDAISVFQGASQDINSMFNFIPREAMTQTIAARYMRRFKGDPVAAKIAFQRDLASGGIVKEAVSAARMQGGRGMAALALSEFLGDQLGMAEDILPLVGRYKGPGKVTAAELEDVTSNIRATVAPLRTPAETKAARAATGEKNIRVMEQLERTKEGVKQGTAEGAGSIFNSVYDTMGDLNRKAEEKAREMKKTGDQSYYDSGARRSPNDPATALLQAAQLLADAAADFRRGRSDLPPVVVG